MASLSNRLNELAQRSEVPSPVSRFNAYTPPVSTQTIIYSDESFPHFLNVNGIPIGKYRLFLEDNQIANPFEELTAGRSVIVRDSYTL